MMQYKLPESEICVVTKSKHTSLSSGLPKYSNTDISRFPTTSWRFVLARVHLQRYLESKSYDEKKCSYP